MKSKDFIKMIQEADPSGEAHVRLSYDSPYGGIPFFCELKEGYWDGAYSYINDDGNYVYSIMGLKLDINHMTVEDYVHDRYGTYNPNITDMWETIKNKFIFELDGFGFIKQERIDEFLTNAKLYYDDIHEASKKLYFKSLAEMEENARKGWKWFQNKDVDLAASPNIHYFGTWRVFNEKGIMLGSNIHMTQSVLYSNKWDRLDNGVIDGFYEWKYKQN